MQISHDALNEFMALYQAEFGKKLSRQDALEMTTRLINLYLIIYSPVPGELGDEATRLSGDRHDLGAAFPKAE